MVRPRGDPHSSLRPEGCSCWAPTSDLASPQTPVASMSFRESTSAVTEVRASPWLCVPGVCCVCRLQAHRASPALQLSSRKAMTRFPHTTKHSLCDYSHRHSLVEHIAKSYVFGKFHSAVIRGKPPWLDKVKTILKVRAPGTEVGVGS